jgi:hypothetical protein
MMVLAAICRLTRRKTRTTAKRLIEAGLVGLCYNIAIAHVKDDPDIQGKLHVDITKTAIKTMQEMIACEDEELTLEFIDYGIFRYLEEIYANELKFDSTIQFEAMLLEGMLKHKPWRLGVFRRIRAIASVAYVHIRGRLRG